ncbi:MAG: hypothetical protein ACOYIE_02220 [Agathobaculum sp.]|jgi:hypothetical protein|uniref:hypothetical protein n=1 Tax=Agathobaculum sp. TaxID=2048138 RepID=UPI003D8DA41E
MRKNFGLAMQAAGGLLAFLAAGASDMGTISAEGLLYNAVWVVLLYAAGSVLRRGKPARVVRLRAGADRIGHLTAGRAFPPLERRFRAVRLLR